MTLDTHVEQAIARVREEQVAIEGKQTAYKRFVSGVEQISVEPSTTHSFQTATGPVATMHSTPSGTSRKQVRELFADTVRPHSTADIDDTETLLETIAAELTDQIAVALAPQNATTGFADELKNGVLSETAQRQYELRAMEHALEREKASLVGVKDVIDEMCQWTVEANETRLTGLGFEALRTRHDQLDGFRSRCETITQERQSLLHATTSVDGQTGIAHQQLVDCLYVAFPVSYPVLSTVLRVKHVCDECQRAIRDQLIRRV